MALSPESIVTIGMTFPIKDLCLTTEQLALLDEGDMSLLSERVFTILVGNVHDLHGTVRTAVQTLLNEKYEIRNR